MKGYSTHPRTLELEPHLQVQFSVIPKCYPSADDAIDVFNPPIQVGSGCKKTPAESLLSCKTSPFNECLGYYIKQSDGEARVMLEALGEKMDTNDLKSVE